MTASNLTTGTAAERVDAWLALAGVSVGQEWRRLLITMIELYGVQQCNDERAEIMAMLGISTEQTRQ